MNDSLFRPISMASKQVVEVFIDDSPVQAQVGESVAALLLRQPESKTRCHPIDDSARAPYCLMGVCFECLAVINGVASSQTCQIAVEEGMRIERQVGRRKVTHE